ncbi:MAG TPA: quinone-dependent dihydroorotate dehydrogenase [Solirubrobacterales bacterium]|jgi:dihydroorotate dehydrogenase
MIYRLFFRFVLQRLDSERAHAIAIATMRIYGRIPGAALLADRLLRPSRTLEVRTFGLQFRTPLGLAAGVDKNSVAFDGLAALGFGAIEVGTATNLPQPGNPRPRVWRLPEDRALLNAMGFPNDGARAQARRLAKRRTRQVLGVNIGKSKAVGLDGDVIGDYRAATGELARYADYLALNVSSPNTPGLRSMQTAEQLRTLVNGVRQELHELGREIPVLIKLGPDLSDDEIIELADAAADMQIDGIIAVNTTTDFEKTNACRAAIAAHGNRGGLSGQPLKQRALEVLEVLSARVGDLPLISVGGIESAEDAWQRILAGATLVQVHTAFVYGGPLWPRRVNRDLARILEASPYKTIEDAVGKGHLGAISGDPQDSTGTARPRFDYRSTTTA